MTKITAEHLSRSAIVYVRQSTFYQVMNNLESGRRQYGLVERARQLGWSDVQVIDEDLGRSGSGVVLSLEASRLARNGRDWHTLLEFCGLVGTRIVDEDGIYDPRRCGRKLTVHYGSRGTYTQRYACRGAFSALAEMSCISFSGMRVDQVVGDEVLERVQPLGIEAALTAMKNLEREHSEKRLQLKTRWNRPDSKRSAPIASTMRQTRRIDLLRLSLNVVGTSVSSPCVLSRRSLFGSKLIKGRPSLRLIVTVCFYSAKIWLAHGTTPM